MAFKPAILRIFIIFIILMLTSCSSLTPEQAIPPAPETELVSEETSEEEKSSEAEPEEASEKSEEVSEEERQPSEDEIFEERLSDIYWKIEGTTDPEQVLEGYLELQNLAYYSLREVDMRAVLDMTEFPSYNEERWFTALIQRRRLLFETGYCYVNTEPLDYKLTIIDEEELSDQRMDFWRSLDREAPPGEIYIHFVITGEEGEGYSPLLALNAQHTVRMEPYNDVGWLINMHYFPGATRKYTYTEAIDYIDDDQAMRELEAEFEASDNSEDITVPAGNTAYDPNLAAEYAYFFTEDNNEAFYRIDDWSGNCQNFVSQCLLYGFGDGGPFEEPLTDYMDQEWFSGGGGGTSAWENVDYFREYASSGEYLVCYEPGGASELRAGDIIETRTAYTHHDDDPENYNHTLIVTDSQTLLLAQNTPACFVYYCDLACVVPKYLRPVYR